MSWYPLDTRPQELSSWRKAFRKSSALVRWVVLILVTGLGLAAVVGFAVTSLVTMIQNGL